METVLVTGGAGYIGSHTVLDLIKKGFDIIIADDFSNSSKKVISILEKLADRKIKYYELDIRNKEGLREIFRENKVDRCPGCFAATDRRVPSWRLRRDGWPSHETPGPAPRAGREPAERGVRNRRPR